MGFRRLLSCARRCLELAISRSSPNDRSYIRNPCLIASEFGTIGKADSALIRNLNGSGAFIETRKPFRVGEEVQLKFPLHYLDPPVKLTGVIAWVGTDGVGVKFNVSSTNVLRL